jgi:hypothetical protein
MSQNIRDVNQDYRGMFNTFQETDAQFPPKVNGYRQEKEKVTGQIFCGKLEKAGSPTWGGV